MRNLFIALLMLICTAASADDLLLGQYTKHADRFYPKECYTDQGYVCDYKINDEHALVGINANGYTVFIMENSYNRPSLNILRTYSYELTSNIRPYVSIGIMTGYDNKLGNTYKGITPAMYQGIDIHPSSDKWGVMITYVPDYFVGIGLRFNIGEVF